MYIKFRCSAHTRSNKSNIIYNIKSFNERYLIRRRKMHCTTTLGGLLPPSLDILEALALHRLLAGLLLFLAGLLILSFSVDISSKCLVILPSLLKLFLGYNKFLF
jgi:hypothetical protein